MHNIGISHPLAIVLVFIIFCQATRDFDPREQRRMLKFVNGFRSNVATCEYPAANIQQMFWDGDLTHMAQRDVNICNVVSPHGPMIGGVAIFLKNYTHIDDLIVYMRRDIVSRLFLMKASFTRIGCAMNFTSCNDGFEVVCYWFPQCGSLHNAYEEGPVACKEFSSVKSKAYRSLCVRVDDKDDLGDKNVVCKHNSRMKPDSELVCPKAIEINVVRDKVKVKEKDEDKNEDKNKEKTNSTVGNSEKNENSNRKIMKLPFTSRN